MDDVLARAYQDPVYFGFAFLNWHAFDAQARWLRNSNKPINFCRAGNRWGKTESIAIKHLWNCCFKRREARWAWEMPYYTVNTSISLDQATLPLLKAWRLISLESNAYFRDAFISRLVRTPFPRIDFKNGAVWWARSTARRGEYLEGRDFDYATYDECAFDPYFNHILDEVLSIRTLDRGGLIDCISTGKRGSAFNRRFAQAMTDPERYVQQGNTLDNPHLDKAALKRFMATADAGLIEERLYGGERPNEGRIPTHSILRAVANSTGLDLSYTGRRYSTGWDLAKTQNMTVGVTVDITERPYQVVAHEAFNKVTVGIESELSYWEHVWERIDARWQIYGGLTQIDTTGIGSAIGDYVMDIGAEAVAFSGEKLKDLISVLEVAIGLGIFAFPHLERQNLDGTTWTVENELEEVADSLSGLDTATAMALALWGIRDDIQGKIPISFSPKVVGITEAKSKRKSRPSRYGQSFG